MSPLEETLASYVRDAVYERMTTVTATCDEPWMLVRAGLHGKQRPDPHDGKRPRPPFKDGRGTVWLFPR